VTTIYKYVLPTTPGPFTVEMPSGAEALCVQIQCGLPYVYARVDTDRFSEPQLFYACETGKLAPVSSKYVGTAMLLDGAYVLHYFKDAP
jgi:hypothetical protein